MLKVLLFRFLRIELFIKTRTSRENYLAGC